MKIFRTKERFRFHRKYFFYTLALLLTEILIALFVHDSFIRPYAGDFLVVILIYCFIRSFLNTPVTETALCVLLFACALETAQYFNLADQLGFESNKLAKIIIGSSFEWKDMLAYSVGILGVLLIENKKNHI